MYSLLKISLIYMFARVLENTTTTSQCTYRSPPRGDYQCFLLYLILRKSIQYITAPMALYLPVNWTDIKNNVTFHLGYLWSKLEELPNVTTMVSSIHTVKWMCIATQGQEVCFLRDHLVKIKDLKKEKKRRAKNKCMGKLQYITFLLRFYFSI